MGSDEVWAKCAECGTELTADDQSCPKCGSTRKLHDLSVSDGIVFGSHLKGEHRAPWNPQTYTILFSLLAFLSAAFYGTLAVCPGHWVVKLPLAVGWFLVVPSLVFWQKYTVLMFVRWLDKKLIAKKTFYSE